MCPIFTHLSSVYYIPFILKFNSNKYLLYSAIEAIAKAMLKNKSLYRKEINLVFLCYLFYKLDIKKLLENVKNTSKI